MIVNVEKWRQGWLRQFPKAVKVGPRSVEVAGRIYFFISSADVGDRLFEAMRSAADRGLSPRAVVANLEGERDNETVRSGIGFPYYVDSGPNLMKVERLASGIRRSVSSWRNLEGAVPTSREIASDGCVECVFSVDPCGVHVYR